MHGPGSPPGCCGRRRDRLLLPSWFSTLKVDLGALTVALPLTFQ